MESNLSEPAVWSYGIASAAFLAFAAQLRLSWKGNARGALLLSVTAASALWSAAGLGYALLETPGAWVLASLLDVMRYAAWFAFVLALLYVPNPAKPTPARAAAPRWPAYAIGVFVLVCLAAAFFAQRPGVTPAANRLQFALPLALAVLGLVLTEQLYRNVPAHSRWGFKPLCVGLAGIFFFDLYVFAEAFLFAHIDPDVWAARGLAQALIIPFAAVSAARNKEWAFDLAVSRKLVFHSTALLVTGIYLLAVSGAGYYLRFFGGSWGRALQVVLILAAALGLVLLTLSGSLRSKLRVFVNKNFFSYRFDYREEWLRLTRALSTIDPHMSVREISIKGIADLVESPAGALWLRDANGVFRPVARLNIPEQTEIVPEDSPLVRFLETAQWVIELDEFREKPDRYESLVLPEALLGIPDAWLVVPLIAPDGLRGFVVLTKPRARMDVDWEVNDLLKTAGRQAAGFLGQLQATEALLEARKFDAFNRMSAFVVHDLKNLVSQLSLLLKNAERHHDNPEFRRDMLLTIDNVVERMKNLLLQLRAGTTPVDPPRPVDLESAIRRIAQAKSGQRPGVTLQIDSAVQAMGHGERMERVIGHLVQNALDATQNDGKVWVRLWRDDQHALIEIGDTGHGMSPEFVRDSLFKPFHTTKGAGMGIGAYESAQYIKEVGGTITVDSRPGEGTRMRIALPLHASRLPEKATA